MSTSSCGQIRMSSCGQMRISNCRACLRHLSADARHAVQWCRRTGSPADKKGPSPAAQLCIGTGSSGKPRTLKHLWFKSGWVAGGWAALFEARRDLGVQPFFCVPRPVQDERWCQADRRPGGGPSQALQAGPFQSAACRSPAATPGRGASAPGSWRR